MTQSPLPRALADFSPAGGRIKQDYEDFLVEELPLYPASGAGTHTYFLVEKRGLNSMQAVHDIAAALDVPRREIGYAGLKDARATTRQWMSIEHVEPDKLTALRIPRIAILDVTRHTNKLKIGHLRGNAFTIKVRDSQPDRLAQLQDALAELTRIGVPNYFGSQRFGGRGDSWEIGLQVIRGDLAAALDLVLGRPSERDFGQVLQARKLYEAGDYAQAVRHWPGMFRDARRALTTLLRTQGKKKRAFLAIDRGLRNLYVSAYQSHLFNRVVADRLATGLGRLKTGDLAWRHGNGAVFEVLDAEVEQPRADEIEISLTGQLFGYRMSQPSGEPGAAEAQILTEADLTPESFRSKTLRVKGGRRPLRFRPDDARIRLGADRDQAYLELRFALPGGCYATSLLRELFVEHAADVGARAMQGTYTPVE